MKLFVHLPNELEVVVVQVALVGCAKPLEDPDFGYAQPCPMEEVDQNVHGGFDLAELYCIIVETANQIDVALQIPLGTTAAETWVAKVRHLFTNFRPAGEVAICWRLVSRPPQSRIGLLQV